MNTTFTNLQKQNVRITLVATYSAPPVWTVASGDVTLAVAVDGMSAFIISGANGQSVVSVVAQAAIGSAPASAITDTITVTVQDTPSPLGLVADPAVAK